MRARSASASSSVAIAPPSPRQGRFFEGKKEKVAASPSAPAAFPSSSAPAACAASSSTGRPSSRSSGTGATLPNRCTGTIAFVRGVSAAFTVSAVTQKRVEVDVAEHRRGARDERRLGGGVEGERGHHHLVARPDAERAQGDRQRVGAVGHADAVTHAQVGGELALERLHLGAEDVAPVAHHAVDRRAEAVVVGLEAGGEQRGGHQGDRYPTSPPDDPGRLDHGSDRRGGRGRGGCDGPAGGVRADAPGERLHPRAQRGHHAVRRLQRVARRVQPVRGHDGRVGGQPGRLLDRLLGRLRRPRGHPREARQEAAHQEDAPRVGRSLVRAPRRRHGLLHADAADHPHVHLAARRRGADALLALHACSRSSAASPGC